MFPAKTKLAASDLMPPWKSPMALLEAPLSVMFSRVSLLFVPVTEKCPALGTKGDLILCDLTQYAVGIRKEIALDRSIAPGWLEDLTDFRAIVRADGQGLWNKPITPKNGNPLSWCITLAAR